MGSALLQVLPALNPKTVLRKMETTRINQAEKKRTLFIPAGHAVL